MILTIDIGNTTVAFGAVQKQKVLKVERMDTALKVELFIKEINRILKLFKSSGYVFQVAVISSVVPNKTKIVESITKNVFNIDTKVVGVNISVPIKNCYKDPRQVGQDRLVGAYAALKLYGSPVIVIDLGTAITFDVVSGRNEYLGGVIVPGIRLSAESLFLKTALLPKIDIKAPKFVIGKTTQDSILSGLFYGYAKS